MRKVIVAFAVLSLFNPLVVAQPLLTVMQESSPGIGDFSSNVLGTVRAWRTSLSPSQFYDYDGCSYGGNVVMPAESRVLTFFGQTSSGLTLFQLHGAPGGGGARAEFHVELTPRMAGEGWQIFTPGPWGWWYCATESWRRDEWDTGSTNCDFGFARWPLNGSFTLTLEFRQKFFECTGELESPDTPPFQGLLDWMVESSSSPRIEMSLVERQRVRIIPCNSPAISGSLVRCVEGSAEFTVTPTGTPPFSYQWRHNEVEIPGENSRSILVTEINPDDAGSYDCIVTNTCGDVITRSRTLTVCAGDVTCDGAINLSDLAVLLSYFGSGATGYNQGDLDGDGHVGLADLAVLLAAFGDNCN